jgi:hypothetical protein
MTMASNAVFNSYGAVTSYTSPFSPAVLGISRSGNNVLIFWPTNGLAGAVLQESSDLAAWTNSTATIVTSGTNNMATITPQSAIKFYRLGY